MVLWPLPVFHFDTCNFFVCAGNLVIDSEKGEFHGESAKKNLTENAGVQIVPESVDIGSSFFIDGHEETVECRL